MLRAGCPSAHSHWIYTMLRCVFIGLAMVAGLLSSAQAQVQQQVQRNFPAAALRGAITFGQPPEITLNGQAARLAPGARIRGANNLMQMSASLVGQSAVVNYTVEPLGLVLDVWILTPDEAAKNPWPRTAKEAQTWQFDPIAQVWSKP